MCSVYLQRGVYVRVTDEEQLREVMATNYNRPISSNTGQSAVYSVPYHDGFGFGA